MALPLLTTPQERDRFTRRLESFGDLVFGFSLSLLATRLDLPADAHEIFAPKRVLPFIITFAVICAMWLEHYRIFRYHFSARTIDVFLNFFFLFGLALLPYAVQLFITFNQSPITLGFYLGDFAIVMAGLATMRLRGLIAGAADLSERERLRDWKRVLLQFGLVCVMIIMMALLVSGSFTTDKIVRYFSASYALFIILVRSLVRKLPSFLVRGVPQEMILSERGEQN